MVITCSKFKLNICDNNRCKALTTQKVQCSVRTQNGQRYCGHHNTVQKRSNGDFQLQKVHMFYTYDYPDDYYNEEINTPQLDSIILELKLLIEQLKESNNMDEETNQFITSRLTSLYLVLCSMNNPLINIDYNTQSVIILKFYSDTDDYDGTNDGYHDNSIIDLIDGDSFNDDVSSIAYSESQHAYYGPSDEEESEDDETTDTKNVNACGVCFNNRSTFEPLCCGQKQHLCEECWNKCFHSKSNKCPFCRNRLPSLLEFLKDNYFTSLTK